MPKNEPPNYNDHRCQTCEEVYTVDNYHTIEFHCKKYKRWVSMVGRCDDWTERDEDKKERELLEGVKNSCSDCKHRSVGLRDHPCKKCIKESTSEHRHPRWEQ